MNRNLSSSCPIVYNIFVSEKWREAWILDRCSVKLRNQGIIIFINVLAQKLRTAGLFLIGKIGEISGSFQISSGIIHTRWKNSVKIVSSWSLILFCATTIPFCAVSVWKVARARNTARGVIRKLIIMPLEIRVFHGAILDPVEEFSNALRLPRSELGNCSRAVKGSLDKTVSKLFRRVNFFFPLSCTVM